MKPFLFTIFTLSSLTFTNSLLSSGTYMQKHSFQPPYSQQISYWSIGGSTLINETAVKLTPNRPHRTGYIWNTSPVLMTDWEFEVEFSVKGLSMTGGDGFAFWFITQPELLGTVYGGPDFWTGLGIFFDTYNNDGVGGSPSIAAVWNDGSQRFDHSSDGISQAMGSCAMDYRNTQGNAIARIRFAENTLSVEVATSRANSPNGPQTGAYRFEKCISVPNIDLGVDKYFGLTAHTGEVMPDEHVIYSVKTTDYSPSNADLNNVRKQWLDSLEASQQKEGHQNMDQNHFQHTVLTTINQMQETLNLIEMSQLSMSDYLYSLKPPTIAGVSPGGSGDPMQKPLPVPSGTSEQKLDTLSDSIQSVMSQIRSLENAVSKIQPSNNAQSRGASTVDQTQIQRSVTSSEAIVTQVRQLVTELNRKVDELVKSSRGGENQTASLSWFSQMMLLFITVCSGLSAAMHFMNNSRGKERYKII